MSAGASAVVQPETGAVQQAALGPLQAAAYAALSGLSRAAAQTQLPASEYSPVVDAHILPVSESSEPHSQAAHDIQSGLSQLRQPAASHVLPLSQPQPPQPHVQAGHSELIQAATQSVQSQGVQSQAVQSQPTSCPMQTLQHTQAEALPASSLPHAVANAAAAATQDTVSAAAPLAVSPVKSGSSPDGRFELLCDQLAAVLARIPATSDCQLAFSSPSLQPANDDTGGLIVMTNVTPVCLTMHVRAVRVSCKYHAHFKKSK